MYKCTKALVLKRTRAYQETWLYKDSFNELAEEAICVRLGKEVGSLELVYRDIIINVSIAEELLEHPVGHKVFAKIVNIQQIKMPTKILYQSPKNGYFIEVL